MQVEWTWNISNKYVIKSDVCIKLKYIRISLDIYQHISYDAESKKKGETNLSTIKTHQMPNLYQSVIFKLKLTKWYSDTQAAICQWKCIIIKLIWTIFAYNQN